MTGIVILSQDGKIYFSFGEKCLYINDVPKDEKLKGKPFAIYKLLVDNSPNFMSPDQIYDGVWKNNPHPVNDSSIRGHIRSIRQYLGDVTNNKDGEFKYIDGSDGGYRSLQGIATDSSTTKGKKEQSSVVSNDNIEIDDEMLVRNAAHVIANRYHKNVDAELMRELTNVLHDVIMQVTREVWKTFDLSKKFETIFERYAEVLEFIEMLGISNSK